MASANKEQKKKEQMSLVDPIYQRFTKSVIRALGSTDFYAYFMAAIAGADNRIQFSNRKVIKTVDLTWVDAIEESLPGFQTVINNPRNSIKEEEFIVNVANAKRCGSEVVRHLAHHADLVEKFEEDTGDVHPSKLMQRYREDTTTLYENQLVFTALEAAHRFVKIRHDALFDAMSDELGAKLKVETNMASPTETVHLDMFLHINKVESQLDTDDKNFEVFNRISRLFRILNVYMGTDFAQKMSKFERVKGPLKKNNVLKRNPDYAKIVKMFEFLRNYQDIGYTIRVVEQNPEVSESFQQDIYHNVLFNYLVLKGYLQDEEDRQISVEEKAKRRTLKPKFIKQIIEELTEDYDLPDVEVRKVLIEELTKSDLMREESAERHRLVEEQRLRKKEEEERLRREREAEKERIRREKEAEKERIRQEKEQERLRQLEERMIREAENRRRSGLIKKELERFASHKEERLELRQQLAQSQQEVTERVDFADAVMLMEEEETRRREANARLRKQRQQEKELLRIQEEQEQQHRQEEEEQARLVAEEEEKRIQGEQRRQAAQKLRPLLAELVRFRNGKAGQLHARRRREMNRQRLLQERQPAKHRL